MIEKICSVCGKSFMARNNSQIYCSKKCKDKYYNQKKNVLLKESTRIKKAQEKICPFCEENFSPNKHNQKFCSSKCKYDFHRLKL